MARHSPCVGICKLDDASGYCIGCGRSKGEIADWISMNESQRDEVWLKLPERLVTLSIRVRLMPWTRDELIDWAKQTVAARRGTWVIGAPGATAEFPCTAEHQIAINTNSDAIIARASDASFRLRISDKVRAFMFADDGPVVLGLPKGRANVSSRSVVELLGTDTDAIDEAHRNDRLFDFGIGRKSSRFCVRTNDGALAKALSDHSGQHWSEVMPSIGTQLLATGPNRVVESASARIEVFAPIPMPGTQSTAGAHTHFLPEFLKSGEEISASLALPEFAAPIAIFYPSAVSV